MINLCLVVIATQFSETKKRETERMLQERKRCHSSSTLASSAEPGGCYDEIIKYIAHLMHRARRKLSRLLRRTKRKTGTQIIGSSGVDPNFAINLRRKRKRGKTVLGDCKSERRCTALELKPMATDSPQAPRASPEMSDVDPVSSPRRPNCLTTTTTTTSMNGSHPSNDDFSNSSAADFAAQNFVCFTGDKMLPQSTNATREHTLTDRTRDAVYNSK